MPFEPTPAGAYFEHEYSPDTVVDKSNPGDMPAPIQNFEGGNNVCPCFPPDTNGDVGPNHYMQWNNVQFRIWNKTGTPLVGPIDGNELFQPGTPCGDNNDGDPIILYDSYSGRWNGSQFAAPNGTSAGPFYQCIAISTTNDPTGTWCSYNFQVHATKFNDYPKMAVWPAQSAYMMTAPQFPMAGGNGGQGLWGFERTPMLACQPARMVYQDMFTVDPNLPRILAADADGATPPPAGAPAPIVGMNFDGSGNPLDQLQVYNATINWVPPTPTISVVKEGDLQAAPYDSSLCNYIRQCIPQPDTTAKLDTLSNRLMHRLQYRNFGTWQSMVVNHSVDVDGNDHAGVRWYELQKQAAVWTIQQQGTYAPDALHRWMGSVAQDKSGDIAVGYSVSAAAGTYPGIRYAGRLNTDPPGTLAQGEATLINGSGSQTDTRSRWGDYSMMAVDPVDDCTFWYTTEYYQTTSLDRLADADRLVQVPGVRPRSRPAASASAASATTTATTTAARAPEQRLRQRSRHHG